MRPVFTNESAAPSVWGAEIVYFLIDCLFIDDKNLFILSGKWFQAKLRELLRRERRVEFAFEGLRRDDIIRWDIAKDVLNGPIYASNQGTVDMDPSIPQEERATIFQGEKNQVVLEIRKFRNRYMPIPQAELDKNPNLKQTNFKI